eukprot:gene3889-4265_t
MCPAAASEPETRPQRRGLRVCWVWVRGWWAFTRRVVVGGWERVASSLLPGRPAEQGLPQRVGVGVGYAPADPADDITPQRRTPTCRAGIATVPSWKCPEPTDASEQEFNKQKWQNDKAVKTFFKNNKDKNYQKGYLPN